MSERKPGWYWVRETDNWPWIPVKWTGTGWESSDGYDLFCDIIGPRIPTPDEKGREIPEPPSPPPPRSPTGY